MAPSVAHVRKPDPDPAAAKTAPPSTIPATIRMGAIAQVIIALAVTLAVFYVAKTVLITILVAVLLAFTLEPVVRALARVKIPRSIGALIAVLITLAIVGVVLSYSYSRITQFAQDLPKYSSEFRQMALKYRRQAQQLQQTTDNLLATPSTRGQTVAVIQPTGWVDMLSESLGSVTEIVLMLSFIPFLTYFMLTSHDHARRATVNLFAHHHRDAVYATLGQISEMIRQFIAGNLAIGFFLAFLTVIVFGALGLPSFYIVGIISGVLSLLPYLGVLLAMIPPLIVGVGHISRTDLGVIVGTVVGLHLFAFNVLYPKVLGRRLELNPLAVSLSLLFWGFLWGPMGLILALPITGVMKIVFDHVDVLRPGGRWLGE